MYLMGPVISYYGVKSHLLPWLPVIATAYAVNGVLLSKKHKLGARLSSTVMAAIVVTVVVMLPWGLEYPFYNDVIINLIIVESFPTKLIN